MAAIMGAESAQRTLYAALERLGSRQSFRRHSYVYAPGQPAHALYLLVSGQVILQMLSGEGRVLTVKVVEPGHLFGYPALEEGMQYDMYAQVTQPVRVVAIDRATLHRAIGSNPSLGLALIEAVGQHHLTVSRRIEEVAFKSVPARLASVLLEMSSDRHELERPHRWVARRTHQQLAEMVNAYRETVTKIINQFREARLLDVDRSGITLLNPSRLRELSQS